jgi:GT2 family glycosyltransferase
VPVSQTLAPPSPLISRNASCLCGSLRRYKNCCGERKIANAPRQANTTRYAALNAQLAGDYSLAERLYRETLQLTPHDEDALHMLALTQHQQGCIREALVCYLALLNRPDELPDAVWHNLGLTIAAAAYIADSPQAQTRHAAHSDWMRAIAQMPAQTEARVSVVLPSFNHASYVVQALQSVLAQSRPPDEIIVIDDGSTDDSVARIRALLSTTAIAHVFIARENRGAAQTLNEAIERATGTWIAPLNSDDFYDPQRLAQMLDGCARDGIDWGFGSVDIVDQAGAYLSRNEASAAMLYAAHDSVDMSESLGLAFLRNNPAISTGNLFFRKSLWHAVGGFAPLRYNHDWQFCLRAALLAEPVFVGGARYGYRWHAANTIRDDHEKPRREVAEMMRPFVRMACASATANASSQGNPLAPSAAVWGDAFWAILAAGCGLGAVPRELLLAIVDRYSRLSPETPGYP